MARIIENEYETRRIIKLSTNDILSIIQDYQRLVPRFSSKEDTINILNDTCIFIPEEL